MQLSSRESWCITLGAVALGLCLSPSALAQDSAALNQNAVSGAMSAAATHKTNLFMGTLGASIPVWVPQARQVPTPSLTLSYDSAARNSWVGWGWDLTIDHIERDKDILEGYGDGDRSKAMEKAVHVSAAGRRDLVLIHADDGVAEYSTKDGSGARYVYTWGPRLDYWEVWHPSGVWQLFKCENRTLGPMGPWQLQMTADSNGNTIVYTYDSDGSWVYPKAIEYTRQYDGLPPYFLWGHEPGHFIIEFETELREDWRSTFVYGAYTTSTLTKRLRTIRVLSQIPPSWSYEGGHIATFTRNDKTFYEIRRYELSYVPDSFRSLLQTMETFAGDLSLPATTLEYRSPVTTDWGVTNFPTGSTYLGGRGASVHFADFNGDGLTDMLAHGEVRLRTLSGFERVRVGDEEESGPTY